MKLAGFPILHDPNAVVRKKAVRATDQDSTEYTGPQLYRIGHNYAGHNYMEHNYIGQNYIDPEYTDDAPIFFECIASRCKGTASFACFEGYKGRMCAECEADRFQTSLTGP